MSTDELLIMTSSLRVKGPVTLLDYRTRVLSVLWKVQWPDDSQGYSKSRNVNFSFVIEDIRFKKLSIVFPDLWTHVRYKLRSNLSINCVWTKYNLYGFRRGLRAAGCGICNSVCSEDGTLRTPDTIHFFSRSPRQPIHCQSFYTARTLLALSIAHNWVCSTWKSEHNPVSGTLYFKQKTGQWLLSRIVIVILIYHRHKPIVVET
jgi:hypothetical protein